MHVQSAKLGQLYSLGDPQARPRRILQCTRLLTKNRQWLQAVRTFNQLMSCPFNKPMTWDHAMEIYSQFRGEEKDPALLKRRVVSVASRAKIHSRLFDSRKPTSFNGDLFDLINSRVNDREQVINSAVLIYMEIVEPSGRNQFFQDLDGFTEVVPHGEFLAHEGHARFAWFMMNYFLLNNGYGAFYYNDQSDYDSLHDSLNPYGDLKRMLDERI